MRRSIIFAAVILFTIIIASGCGTDEKPQLAELTDWQEYSIVRPDVAGDDEIQAALEVVKAIEADTGVKLTLATDWVKRGDPIPEGTKEILIGGTNRPESENDLKYFDYSIKLDGSRLVINGGSAEALMSAVEWFSENCIDGAIYYPEEGYTYSAEYPWESIMLGDALLSAYAVEGGKEYESAAEELRVYLAKCTGVYPPAESENKIRLVTDSELGITEASAALSEGVVTLSVGEYGLDISEAVRLFTDGLAECENGTYMPDIKEKIEMDSIRQCTDEQIAFWRKETQERVTEILSSPNMVIPDGATVYYVSMSGDDSNDGKSPDSAWRSIGKLNSEDLLPGCYVCFERGGLWRGNLSAKAGVVYTAYGEGEKPKLYGSPFDGADPSLWSQTDAENIWCIELGKYDAGTLVFDDGEICAIKCIIRTEADGTTYNNTTGEPFTDYHDLSNDLHFYHDYKESGKLYLYSDMNPGERFDSIEFNVKPNIISVGVNDVTIDNLCIKYGGAHGVGAGTVKNLTVQNCEFGWIGGSIQAEGIFGRNYATRFGNAVEIYGGCDVFNVTDNYIYQIYDAAITQQYGFTDNDRATGAIKDQKNMTYARNVIEYCNYSIEYFLSLGDAADNPSRMENFLIEDNLMWYAGYGFCEQRPDGGQASHIKGWSGGNRNRAVNYVIRGNLMFETKDMMVQICSPLKNPDGSDSMPSFEGNSFVCGKGGKFGTVATESFDIKAYSPALTDYLDGRCNGDIFWFN